MSNAARLAVSHMLGRRHRDGAAPTGRGGGGGGCFAADAGFPAVCAYRCASAGPGLRVSGGPQLGARSVRVRVRARVMHDSTCLDVSCQSSCSLACASHGHGPMPQATSLKPSARFSFLVSLSLIAKHLSPPCNKRSIAGTSRQPPASQAPRVVEATSHQHVSLGRSTTICQSQR